ncbi:hypothetical protein Lfu02_27740 [Longispora fulva]|uniref:DNRLRE domain-containing protein n=1 Tax=Longispora fulva TaxID=619741 RepID=A0A8J7GH25_9ACTN|nr:hypothetical protein [Longispora fulva]MBG6138909.1 hypothetical protein [Longispora fulva]GIG58402.1 hypothetical protein Lfu02_27740 [Longispora fulva]
MRGGIAALAVTLGVTGLAVFGTAGAASAAPYYEYAPVTQSGYTDSKDPQATFDGASGQGMPIGGWTDAAGAVHKSRAYITFDLASFGSRKVSGATLYFREKNAADCSKRAIEIWRTKPIDANPSWFRSPVSMTKLDESLTPEYCPARFSSDVSAAVNDALATRQKKITIKIKVPDNLEGDVSYGRTVADPILSVKYNSLPVVDETHLFNGGRPCATKAPFPILGGFGNMLQAVGTDADAWDSLHHDFAVWPVDNPAARTEVGADYGRSGRVNTVNLPANVLVSGKTYAWQVRVSDGTDTSAWSKTCTFAYDNVAPATTPTVTSSNYPAGGEEWTPQGVPGEFTFSGGGDADVAGFEYTWGSIFGVPGCSYSGDAGQLECAADPFAGQGMVRATTPGGTAKVSLSPVGDGPQRLMVRSVDRAGNRSTGQAEYEVFVRGSEPQVTPVGTPEWGQQLTLKFAPRDGVVGVTSYEYQLNWGEARHVAAGPDGTATVSFLADNENGYTVAVRSHSANGFVSTQATWVHYFDPWPGVRSDVYQATGEPVGGVGVAGTFTFSRPAGWTAVKEYRYSVNGEAMITVPAGADGRATFTWTPTASGDTYFEVWAVRPDGTVSDYSNSYGFTVA